MNTCHSPLKAKVAQSASARRAWLLRRPAAPTAASELISGGLEGSWPGCCGCRCCSTGAAPGAGGAAPSLLVTACGRWRRPDCDPTSGWQPPAPPSSTSPPAPAGAGAAHSWLRPPLPAPSGPSASEGLPGASCQLDAPDRPLGVMGRAPAAGGLPGRSPVAALPPPGHSRRRPPPQSPAVPTAMMRACLLLLTRLALESSLGTRRPSSTGS
jgi:hypothetical protein